MTSQHKNVKVSCTEEEAEALRMRRVETDAEGIARLLDLTPQRVYQLEKSGVIARTKSGNYNITDTVVGYIAYKQTGEILPPAPTQSESNGCFIKSAEDTTVTAAELAAILGITPSHVERLTIAGILKPVEPDNGIAEHINLEAIAGLDLRAIMQEYGKTDEAIENAERKRDAFIAAVKVADHMKPSRSKWELYEVQDRFNAFLDALPSDIVPEQNESACRS